jgi:negative modulator of initiation of replication
MLHPVALEDDVFQFIARKALETGRSPSDLLRKWLQIGVEPCREAVGPVVSIPSPDDRTVRLSEFFESPTFTSERAVVGRYLVTLAHLHEVNPETFGRILAARGNKRRYFANDRESIETSGVWTLPQQIPGSEYWALTNENAHRMGTSLLGGAMNRLGYSLSDQDRAAKAVSG